MRVSTHQILNLFAFIFDAQWILSLYTFLSLSLALCAAHMSGGSTTTLFSIAAPTAEICSSIAQIHKLVELKESSRASCAVCAQHRLLLPAISRAFLHSYEQLLHWCVPCLRLVP